MTQAPTALVTDEFRDLIRGEVFTSEDGGYDAVFVGSGAPRGRGKRRAWRSDGARSAAAGSALRRRRCRRRARAPAQRRAQARAQSPAVAKASKRTAKPARSVRVASGKRAAKVAKRPAKVAKRKK